MEKIISADRGDSAQEMSSLPPSFILLFFPNIQILKKTSLQALKSTIDMKNEAQCTTFKILSLLLKTQNMQWVLKTGHFTTVQWLFCSYSESLAKCPICIEKFVCMFGIARMLWYKSIGWGQEAGALQLCTSDFDKQIPVYSLGTVQSFGLSLPIYIVEFTITFIWLMVRIKLYNGYESKFQLEAPFNIKQLTSQSWRRNVFSSCTAASVSAGDGKRQW